MANKRAHIALLAGTAAAVLAVFIACETQDESPAGFSVNFVGMEAGAFGLESFVPKADNDPRMYLPNSPMTVKGDNVTVALYDIPSDNNPDAHIAIRSAGGKVTGLNYIGCDVGDMSGGAIAEAAKEKVLRYISVPVSCAGRLSVLYKGNNTRDDIATDEENHLQIAFVTEDGTVLTWQPVPVMDTSVKETGVRMLSADITKAETVRMVFSRNDTHKGGNPDKLTGSIDVFSITFVPAQ
ncbi:MAG: hypothetical protein K2I74_07965 [Treponemataceae bacterium]|nr:hypothetical protein [Treponemataceae bacterium]